MPPSTNQPENAFQRGDRRWDVVALLVLVLASLYFNRALIGEDLTRVVPVSHPPGEVIAEGGASGGLENTDMRFVVWLLSRNARTLATRPWQIHQAEQCHPVRDSLALGEPAITQGLFGVPGYLMTRDPIATYNFIWLALPLFSALVMYVVVKQWTASPPAAIVAALLYAFAPLKVYDPVHFYVYDTVWTLLAVYFAWRLFERPAWRHALGLTAATAMQLAGSFYTTMAAALIGLPFLAWLIRHYGVRHQRPAHWAAIAGLLSAVLLFLVSPFVGLIGEGALETRVVQGFRPLAFLLPSQKGFPGFFTLALIVAAFALPAPTSHASVGRQARFVLLLAVILIWWSSIGSFDGEFGTLIGPGSPGDFPNPLLALAQWIPGLGLVRAPGAIFNCAVAWIAILAGVGVACLLPKVPVPGRAWAAAALVGVAAIDVLRPPVLGLEPDFVFSPTELRPGQTQIDFYADLAAKGSTGPLLWLPAVPRNVHRESGALLLSAYHGRRVGQCYNSYQAAETARVREQSTLLPDAEALDALAEMGFTTLVVNVRLLDRASPGRSRDFDAATMGPSPRLREIHADGPRKAYEIIPRPSPKLSRRAPAPYTGGHGSHSDDERRRRAAPDDEPTREEERLRHPTMVRAA